jgi:hypothetical protein
MKRLRIDAVVEEMHKAGCSAEQIGAVVLALQVVPPKSAAAIRQARYRERKEQGSVTKSVTVTPNVTHNKTRNVTHNVTPSVTPLARVEDNSTNLELTGKKKEYTPKASRGVMPTPRDILLECLKPETADAVLAHRKALHCQLTLRAAELLVKGFNSTADPEGAANEMILRGWRGFKAGWEKDKPNGSGKKRGSISDVAPGFIERLDKQFAYLDEVRPEDRGPEGGPTVRLLPSQRGQRS